MSSRWRAPGRVNLIGEHTDYNDGFALPFALTQSCVAVIERADGDETVVRSAQQDAPVTLPHDMPDSGLDGWAGYAAGAIWVLRGRGYDVPALRIDVDSTVPVGSGLSSSAALVCSVTRAVDDLLGLGLSDDDLLAVSRAVENDVVGAPTGGMDQLASLFCQEGSALFCDMRSLVREPVPLALAEHRLTIMVLDTHATHQNSDGEYGRRRAGCEKAAALLGVRALRDVDEAGLPDALDRLPDDELRRYVRHVVTEDARVLQVVDLLRAGDVPAIGPLLTASHVSMRDDYRITVAEIDVAVDALLASGALGARMTGGGFGGCAIALIDPEFVEAAADEVAARFEANGFTAPSHFTVDVPAAGAHRE